MVANRGHEIVPEALSAETEHRDHFSEEPIWSPREVGISRICTSYMRAEGAADAFGISIVRELILPNLIGIRSDAGNRFLLKRRQGVAVFRSSDHSRRKLFSLRKIATRLLAEKIPKAPDILMQLAHDEIRSISADISFLGGVLRREQTGARRIGVDQRPTGIFPVFVPIPQQELAESGDVGVVTLKTERRLELEKGETRMLTRCCDQSICG